MIMRIPNRASILKLDTSDPYKLLLSHIGDNLKTKFSDSVGSANIIIAAPIKLIIRRSLVISFLAKTLA